MADLAIIILTRNEEIHIARALSNVAPIAREVFVIDSFSTDNTVELARAQGAVVLKNNFINYAKQFEWALKNAPIQSEWIMRLDADELLSAELIEEIERVLPSLPRDVTGISLKRRHIFLGRWIRHGGRYPLVLLRIWRKGFAQIEQRWMDEHMSLTGGTAITLTNDFSDVNLKDLSFFTEKHNGYATREAIDVLNQRYRLSEQAEPGPVGSRQAVLKRRMKERLYNRLGIWPGPFGYFIFRYVIQLGILDGREGLIYHFLQGLWYRFLVAAKVEELDRALRDLPGREARIAELARLTGYRAGELT
jgi:glycosyltransferase involved in cell wall biosynthesis